MAVGGLSGAGTDIAVVLKAMCWVEITLAGVLHRREAHHIHNAGGSGRLNSGKSLAPGGTERFHFGPAHAAKCRVESKAAVEAWNQWRAVHDHGAHREPGGSTSATEAHRPADSGGMRGLRQSPPRLVLLPGKCGFSRS